MHKRSEGGKSQKSLDKSKTSDEKSIKLNKDISDKSLMDKSVIVESKNEITLPPPLRPESPIEKIKMGLPEI